MLQTFLQVLILLLPLCKFKLCLSFQINSSSKTRHRHKFQRWNHMQEQFLTEEQFFEISRMTESTSTQSDDLDDKSLSRQNELLKSRLKLLEFVVSFLRHKVMDLSRALASSEATREVLRAEEVERQQKFNRDWITLQKMESEKIKVSN